MVVEASVSDHLEDTDAMVKKKLVDRKKNGAKVPKKISKAEREKLKRDHMNVLFLELGNVLEPANQNNGKSCMITDTIGILQNLLSQVDCLRKENATLLSESVYVKVEKDELKEETSILENQIVKLQAETVKSHSRSFVPKVNPGTHVLMMPKQNEQQFYPNPDTSESACKLPSNVSRPHARYPSSSHTWPSNILFEQPLVEKKVS